MLPQPGNSANPRTLDIGSLLEMKKNGQVASGNYWLYSHNSPANLQMSQDEKLELEVTRKKEKEWKKQKYCYLFHRKTTLYLGRSPKGDPSMKFRLILSIHWFPLWTFQLRSSTWRWGWGRERQYPWKQDFSSLFLCVFKPHCSVPF